MRRVALGVKECSSVLGCECLSQVWSMGSKQDVLTYRWEEAGAEEWCRKSEGWRSISLCSRGSN